MKATLIQQLEPTVIAAPYSNVHVGINDLPDHTLMRSQQLSSLLLAMPLHYAGGDFGLTSDGEEPWIVIVDSAGTKWTTHSVEWVLRNIIHFTPRCQSRILADSAVYFGMALSEFVRADVETESPAVNSRPPVMWAARLALQIGSAS